MVISKAVKEQKDAEAQAQADAIEQGQVAPSRWHTKAGNLTAKGKTLKGMVLEFLETQEHEVPYSDVRNHLIANHPNDYTTTKTVDGEEVTVRTIDNRDIKIMCQILASEGAVIDQ